MANGGEVGFHIQDSLALGEKQVKNGKSAKPKERRLHQPPEQLQLKCPECSSKTLCKDGMRYLSNGESIQRFLCCNCGYRFSEKRSPSKLLQETPNWQINTASTLLSTCQERSESRKRRAQTLQVGGQTLVTSETRQEIAQREGTTQTLDAKGKIVEYTFWLQKEGYSKTTILGRTKLLKILTKRGANLYDPDSIKAVIAKQQWSEGRKTNAADAYSSFLKMTEGKWEPPKYQRIRKIPFIPTETEIDQLIAGCSKRAATFLQLLKETGIRPGEAWQLKWTDLDQETKTVRITPEKNSNPRIFHISPKLASMLEAQPKTYGDRIFSRPDQPLDHYRDSFCQQRKRIAYKLKNPRLQMITFKTFRHWKGTMEYHKTKDILHVMQTLGHKNIKNTLVYVHLAEELFKDQQEYISKVAKNEKDACALVEAGFEFVCDFDNHKIFRKNKH